MIIEVVFWVSLFLAGYTYFGYYLILLILSKLTHKNRKSDLNYSPTVSMVIAAYNEEKVIKDKIKNCLELDYPKDKIEFLIGSDGSNDNTNIILQHHQNSLITPYFFESRRGKAAVINILAENARGEILIFSDANTMYKKDAIGNLTKHFVDPQIGGVCGRLELLTPNDDIGGKGESLYWDYENQLKYLESKIKTVFGANGAIYAIKRNLFQKLPESIITMDDFLIPLKIIGKKFDVVYEGKAIGREPTASNLKGEFLRKIRISAGNFNSFKEIWPLLSPKKGFVAFGLWSHKIIRWFVPFLLIFIFITNLLLLGTSLYNIFFMLQLTFYLASFYGFIVSAVFKTRVKIFSYCYYFISMNIALLIGFFKFLFKTQKPTWAKLDR